MRVERRVARLTPIGTSRTQAVTSISMEYRSFSGPDEGCPKAEARVGGSGHSHVHATIDEHILFPLPIVSTAYAEWCFDRDEKLISVVGSVGTDGP